MQFSQLAWQHNHNLYQAIVTHPFNQELRTGQLARAKFSYYIQQDYLYLQEYARILAKIAGKADRETLRFLEFAQGVFINEQQGLHHHYLTDSNHQLAPSPSIAGLGYTSYLHAASNDSVEVAIAAVLPCFWIYYRLGCEIQQAATVDKNPYQRWIDTYASEDFASGVNDILKIADDYYHASGAIIRHKMLTAFTNSTQWEYYFWDDAYHQRSFLIF